MRYSAKMTAKHNVYIYVCMHIYSENVKFIIVNLKEIVVKMYCSTSSLRLTTINFTFSEYMSIYISTYDMYTHTHIHIYILVSISDYSCTFILNIHKHSF